MDALVRQPVAGHFCSRGGTRLWHETAMAGGINLKPGTLDDTRDVAPRLMAYAARKPAWLEVSGLEHTFERQPPGPTRAES